MDIDIERDAPCRCYFISIGNDPAHPKIQLAMVTDNKLRENGCALKLTEDSLPVQELAAWINKWT